MTLTITPSCLSHETVNAVFADPLSGKLVVFVTPGYPGKRFVFDKAHELGVRAIVIDNPNTWVKSLVKEGIIDSVIEVDMSQPDEDLFIACVSAIEALPYKVDGICTFVELSAPLTARLCERFGVKGHSVASVSFARDKHMTRKVVSDIYAVRYVLLESESDLVSASDYVGFPAVVKPVGGAASLGVQRVDSVEDLEKVYASTRQLLKELVVSSGALERRVIVNGTDTTTSASEFANHGILLEEYIDGQEVDIDMVVYDSKVTYCEISDNGPTMEPYFGETWSVSPSLLPFNAIDALSVMARRVVVDSLGFTDGVFHVEAKFTTKGECRLIEVNCRMGGGPVWNVQRLRNGIDLVEEQIRISVGLAPTQFAASSSAGGRRRPAIGFASVNALRSGTLRNLDFFKFNFNNCKFLKPAVSIGEKIIGPEDGQPSWIAELIIERDSPEEARDDVIKYMEEIQYKFIENS
jgi:biotin carboxylase